MSTGSYELKVEPNIVLNTASPIWDLGFFLFFVLLLELLFMVINLFSTLILSVRPQQPFVCKYWFGWLALRLGVFYVLREGFLNSDSIFCHIMWIKRLALTCPPSLENKISFNSVTIHASSNPTQHPFSVIEYEKGSPLCWAMKVRIQGFLHQKWL